MMYVNIFLITSTFVLSSMASEKNLNNKKLTPKQQDQTYQEKKEQANYKLLGDFILIKKHGVIQKIFIPPFHDNNRQNK